MKSKCPQILESWGPHIGSSDGSDKIVLVGLDKLLKDIDASVGSGPRGLLGHHLITVHRTIDSDTSSGATLRLLSDFGTAIISAECPWVSLGLGTNLLTLARQTTSSKTTEQGPHSIRVSPISETDYEKTRQRHMASPLRIANEFPPISNSHSTRQ